MIKPHTYITGHSSVKVKCVETGIVYHSLSQAERITGLTTIRQWYQGRQLTVGGYHWETV